jgi:drug/metabolite transporter (DMT)-like permease
MKNFSAQEIGLIFMATAALCLPICDAIAKWLSLSLSPAQIALFRFGVQTLILIPFMVRTKRVFKSFQVAYIFMGASLALALLTLFWGLLYLPLANNIALFFIEPLILILLSSFFLKEKITKEQYIGVVGGLFGALIVLRPNFMDYGFAAILPMLAAFFYASYLAITRAKVKKDVVGLQFWVGFFATTLIGASMLLGSFANVKILEFREVNLTLFFWIIILVLLSFALHILIALAMQRSKASSLASLQYLELISATILGWLIFKDIPDFLTIVGALIIVIFGIYTIKTNRAI